MGTALGMVDGTAPGEADGAVDGTVEDKADGEEPDGVEDTTMVPVVLPGDLCLIGSANHRRLQMAIGLARAS